MLIFACKETVLLIPKMDEEKQGRTGLTRFILKAAFRN